MIPLPEKTMDEVRPFRRPLGGLAGWVFQAERTPNQAMDRHLFDKWLSVAEKRANLPKLEGGMWHPYRRKWAIEPKHLPIKDVAAAGRWSDVETLLTCYQHADKETLLSVMNEPRKVTEVVSRIG